MKAQGDVIYLAIYGFCVAVAAIMILVAWNGISTNSSWQTLVVQATPQGNSINTNVNTSLDLLGNGIAFIWIISGIASILATFFIDSAPVFAVVGIILMPIEAFLGMLFHDYFFIIAQNTFIAPVVNGLPVLAYFFGIYPIACLILAIGSIIFTFIKP